MILCFLKDWILSLLIVIQKKFLNYRVFTANFDLKLDYNFLEFSNFKDLPMNSFENENDNHSIEIKDFFPKYTFGINLQYNMENFTEHKIYLQVGSVKMNVSILTII